MAAAFREPMLAQLVKPLEHTGGSGWLYERKLDGLRCVAVRSGERVELWSRNHLSFNARFPAVVAALRALAVEDVTLDGELVAYSGSRTSFAELQRPEARTHPVLAVFDLLDLLGRDVTDLALTDRKRLLAHALQGAPAGLQLVEPLEGDPLTLLQTACEAGWEGLVAKRATSLYHSGRSADWQKLKCMASQELVVGGWTDPSGARVGLGALLVGYFDDGGSLRYAGKVGTGFSDKLLRSLLLELRGRATDTSPFADPVPMKRVHWVQPELVAEVSFSEWTRDGRLRHPSFQGLRPDKAATEVRREVR